MPISNFSYVYSFLAVTFPSISQKLPSSLNSAVLLLNAKKFQITLLLDTSGIQQHDEHGTNVSLTVHISVCPSPSAYFSSNHFLTHFLLCLLTLCFLSLCHLCTLYLFFNHSSNYYSAHSFCPLFTSYFYAACLLSAFFPFVISPCSTLCRPTFL